MGYFVAVFVGIVSGTATFFLVDTIVTPDTGHVLTTRQMLDGFFELVRFTSAFAVITVLPAALVGSIVLVPSIVWATKAGIRSAWATAICGALAIAALMFLPILVMAFSGGPPATVLMPIAFAPTGAVAALTYRAVVLFRFDGKHWRA